MNVFGFVEQSRYLPDGRDLNRAFPGSKRGSLAAQLAHLFMQEVVLRSDVGLDLHTAAGHRTNVPQIRADLDDGATLDLAGAFGAPFLIHARLRDGSLREAVRERGIPVLLYEAGETHRFDEASIAAGVEGTLRVLARLDMGGWEVPGPSASTRLATTTWVRARRAGIAELEVDLGDRVERGERLGAIGDAIGGRTTKVSATAGGFVIARTLNPLVAQGDALVHIGTPPD